MISSESYFYDGRGIGDYNTEPTQGLLTHMRTWVCWAARLSLSARIPEMARALLPRALKGEGGAAVHGKMVSPRPFLSAREM